MKDKEKKMTWYDVTLGQYKRLVEAFNIENEEERLMEVTRILLGDEVLDLSLQDFFARTKELEFIKEEMPSGNPPKTLKINNREYYMDCLLGNITTAQYIDYANHSKTGDMAKMLSVFIIPKNHKYNDGYDMLQVFNDINDIPIPVVNSAAFFFSKQFSKFLEIFQRYSIKSIKRTKLPKETKKQLVKVVENSLGSVLYHLS